ncbi:uncharacterized protein Z519_12079 [Cladophialophora bantiana CBS 173.52]|uniref:Unplaced genomic scaffold supercont1.25, whole genome shotgun sequence n=1 Tax=Cladophialophora bantiana (strain ATCC 10958 / CBS 173.52 / CDC B-1940 / NIH 8579) TaxID=1442370 RepID=A0A0D2H2A8_CLAB1|nr:uncharacterized protein Z519_12079 [Cladophialophora bantiana CBS 173.52]KIW87443.1 hypothetical protein Z519_12079 [Cladophialophora bantiana CBS 173.52]
MCRFKLHVCPYPDQDPVSSLIFNPKNSSQWEHCDEPRPWGRLSCGKLVIEHPRHLIKAEPSLSSPNTPTPLSCNSDQCEQHIHTGLPDPQEPVPNNLIVPPAAGEARLQGEPCKWCTAVLKLVATKSKETQQVARKEIAEVERTMGGDIELRKMHEKIADKARELNAMRHNAWRRATMLMDDLAAASGKETQG